MKYPQLVSMPSAVSDWLEEQLEARGIDAIVYTRYVLSLLYRDPVDIICPDQDLHITNPNKEVRRTGGSRKRFCRSNDYWGHADADQLKRSAAVECLKSASDQKCGIESLVDELCSKLKAIQNESNTNSDTIHDNHHHHQQQQQQQQQHTKRSLKNDEKDSAKRYYAAFPALSRNTATTSPKLIQLIPKWFGSPKRRLAKRQNRAASFEDKLHSTCKSDSDMKARSVGKQRFNYFSRNTTANNYNHNFNANFSSKKENVGYAYNRKMNFYNNQRGKDASGVNVSQRVVDDDDDESMMYDDLPVDIRDLLDSPTPQGMHVDLMNLANMRDAGGSKKFIQCGTNIISSIWSTKEAPLTLDDPDPYLDYKFSNISIDRNLWSSPLPSNNESDSLDRFEDNKSIDDPWNYKMEKWSDGYDQENHITRSLMKLNHDRQGSCFLEVKPRMKAFQSSHDAMTHSSPQPAVSNQSSADAGIVEDLLHSASSHFKPINEKVEAKLAHHVCYADGTTFAIASTLETIHYERSETDTLILEEHGVVKRYGVYKNGNDDDFVLKFRRIDQNDKACQTDEDVDVEQLYLQQHNEEEFYFPGDRAQLDEVDVDDDDFDDNIDDDDKEEAQWKCTCPAAPSSVSFCSIDSEKIRPDSMMAELFGKESKCDKCNSPSSWTSPKPIGWKNEASTAADSGNIWNGEICMACLRCNSSRSGGFKLTPLDERKQLRDDIKEDGEQLLSDLSSAQRSYMEEEDLPMAAEETCDLYTLIAGARKRNNSNKEWKELRIKQGGGVPIHSASFSFATRLQQDCLMKMATIPTLRSVTL